MRPEEVRRGVNEMTKGVTGSRRDVCRGLKISDGQECEEVREDRSKNRED